MDFRKMDLTKIVNLYHEYDKKTSSDDQHVVFKINNNEFSVGIFEDETNFMWGSNKDATLLFITKNEIPYIAMINCNNNIIKYHDLSHTANFSHAFKNELYNNNIKSIAMSFKNGLNKNKILPYIKMFIVLLSLYSSYISN